MRVFVKFISHTHFCTSSSDTEKVRPVSQSTTESVALTLWSKTLLKTVKDTVSIGSIDEEALVKKIRRKWFSLSENFQTCWHQAAKVLLEVSNARDALRNHEDSNTKGKTSRSSPAKVIGAPAVSQQSTKHPHYHSKRDTRGRWSSKEEKAKVMCDVCNVEFPNEWKLKRHQTTKKHLEMSDRQNLARDQIQDQVNRQRSENQTGNYELDQDDDGSTECVDEREILYESPCDIIMEDQSN